MDRARPPAIPRDINRQGSSMDGGNISSPARDEFDDRKELYKERRDAFRENPAAMAELAKWKAQDNDCNYTIL